MPTIPVDKIIVPERLRFETYGDIEQLASSLEADGQLQDILVRPAENNEDLFELVDGGRRLQAAKFLEENDRTIAGLDSGAIGVKLRDEDDNPLTRLRLEFYANHYREDFSWKEQAKFYRQAHEILQATAKAREVPWSVELSAQYLQTTQRTLYRYLELTEDAEIFESESVSSAETFNVAAKKAKIEKDKRRRKKQVEVREKSEKARGVSTSDYYAQAAEIVTHSDAIDWIGELGDESVDFAHWDPPYGGEQDGGAFSSHERIDDSEEYAKELMSTIIPELYRVLRPGSWLAIWFHQSHREWVRESLESAGFWVNPYECIWYKANRKADGHEITRFLCNAYEPFFLAGKPHEDPDSPLVLPDSSPQNVFVHDLPSRSARSHPMEKPSDLLAAILDVISIPGELGIDPSAGSGSIIPPCLETGRKLKVCELSETYFLGCIEKAARTLRDMGVDVPKSDKEVEIPEAGLAL